MSEQPAGAPAFLTIDDLSGDTLGDRETREVFVPQWNRRVVLQAPSLGQVTDAERRAVVNGRPDETRMGILLLASCLLTPRLSEEQAELLLQRSPAALALLLAQVTELAGLGEETPSAASFPD